MGTDRGQQARRRTTRGGIPELGACPARALRSPSLRALRFLSPSALHAQGKERSSPSPGELRQGPLAVAVLAAARRRRGQPPGRASLLLEALGLSQFPAEATALP